MVISVGSLLVLIAFVIAGITIHSWVYRRFRAIPRIYSSHDESIKDLTRDVRRAAKRVLVLCRHCRLDSVAPTIKENLRKALVAAHAKGVAIDLICQFDDSGTLRDLAAKGIIRLQKVASVPLYVRLVDNAVVQIAVDNYKIYQAGGAEDSTLVPVGLWVRTRSPDDELTASIEKLAREATARPNLPAAA